jgi:hypothetical protein
LLLLLVCLWRHFYPRELAKLRGYSSCFVVVVVVVVVVVACPLLNEPDTAAGQPRAHAVWYPATAATATAAACMQFGILPLQVTAERLYAV